MRFLIAIFLSVLSAQAATLYCGPSSTGSGTGADFNNLLQLPTTTGFVRGNTYVCIEGSYGARTFSEPESSTTLVTIRKASTADSAVAGYATTLFDGQAIFGTLTVFTSYFVFDGVTGGGPSAWNSGHGFKISGGSIPINPAYNSVRDWTVGVDSIRIAHVEIDGIGTSGTEPAVGAAYTDGLTLEYLYTHDNAECFLNSLQSDNAVVQYCYVGEFCTDCSPAIHGEIFSWKYIGDIIIRYNLFVWVESTGGIMIANSSSDNVQVYRNIFYRPSAVTWSYGGDGVVGGWVGRTDLGVWNMKVYHNTFINIPSDALSPLGSTPGTVSGRLVKNNLFYNSDTGLPSGDWTEDYNHYVDSGGESESNGTAATGDPFTDFVGLDFSLASDTTAGEDLGSPYNVDMFGNTGRTRGAIEFDEGGADATPPTLSSATIDATGTTLTLAFDDTVSVGAGGNGGWTVSLSGGAATVSYSSGAGTPTLVYSISRTIAPGETGTVSYTQPTNGIEDEAGNDLANVSNAAITNNASSGDTVGGAQVVGKVRIVGKTIVQ